uniref:Uncharacterized protein n=1 Tax=Octopus bimaculoides TaxID=37653 RepID=A0A0L8GU66_OCTBM
MDSLVPDTTLLTCSEALLVILLTSFVTIVLHSSVTDFTTSDATSIAVALISSATSFLSTITKSSSFFSKVDLTSLVTSETVEAASDVADTASSFFSSIAASTLAASALTASPTSVTFFSMSNSVLSICISAVPSLLTSTLTPWRSGSWAFSPEAAGRSNSTFSSFFSTGLSTKFSSSASFLACLPKEHPMFPSLQ